MDRTIAEIAAALRAGESVIIRGFGTFRAASVPAREHRNPKTGEKITKPAHRTVRFKVSKAIFD